MPNRFADMSRLMADIIVKTMEPTADLLDLDIHAVRSNASKFDFPIVCGVYFLFKDEVLAYIGQSVNVYSRLQQHKVTKGVEYFDAVAVVPTEKRLLDVVESWYWHRFKPRDGGRPPITKFENIERRLIEMEMPKLVNTYMKLKISADCIT